VSNDKLYLATASKDFDPQNFQIFISKLRDLVERQALLMIET